MTVPDLRPNSQDTSAFYLGNIYEVLTDPNATRASTPSPVSQPPPFSPPRSAIWVNSLWFLSFVISLTCALLATSLHQWSNRYLMVTQPAWSSPDNRARIRAFYAEGTEQMHVPWVVEALPMLLHLSVFLFFGGLVIFLFNVDHTIFSSVTWWIVLSSIVYASITVMPIVRHNSPYYVPLSKPAWFMYTGMNYVLFKVLASKFGMSGTFGPWGRFSVLRDYYHRRMVEGLEAAAKKTVAERSSELDIRVFDWTTGVLGDDDSLETFFEAVPGFFSSKVVNNLESDFPEDVLNRFWTVLNRFMDRTLSSDSVIESVKTRRVKICRDITSKIPFPQVSIARLETMARWRAYVLESTCDGLGEDGAWEEVFESVPGFFDSEVVDILKEHLPNDFRIKFSQALNRFLDRTLSVTESARSGRLITCLNAAHAALGRDRVSHILWEILNGRWPELLHSVEIGHSLRRWSNTIDERFTPDVRRIVAQIVIGAWERKDRWIALVRAEFGVPDRDLRKYITDRDSVLLSILIHVTRQALQTGSWTPVLSSLSEFSILDTLPQLQQAFCALWNDILFEARNRGEANAYVKLLREIRAPYIELHRGTDAALTFPAATHYFDPVLVQPSSYRYCKIAGHRQDLSVYTPSLIFPSLTPLDQLPTPSAARPHSSPVDSDHTPDGSTVSQHAEEENIIVGTLSSQLSADHIPDPSNTEGFTPSLLATNSFHVSQATFGPSVPGSVTRDPDRLVPGEASHDLSQSAPSSAENTNTDYVQSDDPTTLIHTGESGEIYQVSAISSLLFQHDVIVPATITPSTGPDPGSGPDMLQDTTSSAILSHPLEGIGQQDTVSSREASDIGKNPTTVNPIPRSTVSPTIVVTEPLSPPILLPAISSGMTATGLPLFVESTPIQPDHFSHAPSQSSSIATTSSHISTQVASAFDAQVTSRIVTSNPTHDDSRNLDPPIPMTLLPHLNQMTVDMVANTLSHEDQVQHDSDGLWQ